MCPSCEHMWSSFYYMDFFLLGLDSICQNNTWYIRRYNIIITTHHDEYLTGEITEYLFCIIISSTLRFTENICEFCSEWYIKGPYIIESWSKEYYVRYICILLKKIDHHLSTHTKSTEYYIFFGSRNAIAASASCTRFAILFGVLWVLDPAPEKSKPIEEIPNFANSHAIGRSLSLSDFPAPCNRRQVGVS